MRGTSASSAPVLRQETSSSPRQVPTEPMLSLLAASLARRVQVYRGWIRWQSCPCHTSTHTAASKGTLGGVAMPHQPGQALFIKARREKKNKTKHGAWHYSSMGLFWMGRAEGAQQRSAVLSRQHAAACQIKIKGHADTVWVQKHGRKGHQTKLVWGRCRTNKRRFVFTRWVNQPRVSLLWV